MNKYEAPDMEVINLIIQDIVTLSVDTGDGDDYVVVEEGMTIGCASLGYGNDTFINYGTVSGSINGGEGDDSIVNYGKVEGEIYGQNDWETDTHLNDYLFVGANSSIGGYGAGSIDAAQAANKITQIENIEVEGGLKTINLVAGETKEIEVVGADGKTYKYTVENRDTGASTTLSYGLNGDGQIEFNSENGRLDITAFSGQKDNVVVDGQYINFNAGDLDDTIVVEAYGYASYIAGGEGNDSIVNKGNVGIISGETGNDSIVNEGEVENIYGYGGNDSIVNAGIASSGIEGGDGADIITNAQDAYTSSIYGGAGADIITNYGEVGISGIGGGAGDDSIVNSGKVNYINAGDGNNTVTNEKTGVISSSVYLGAGDDILYNYGEINDFYGESIVTEDGKDSVFNYGTVSGSINTGADNDYILIASDNNELNAGDGNDSVFLNGNYNVAYAGQGDDETTIMGNNNFAYGEDGSGGTGFDKVIATGSNNTYSEMNELLGGVETEFSVVTDYKMNDESLYNIKFSSFLPDIELDVSSTENAQNTLEQLNEIIESITQSRAKIGMQSTLLKEHLDANIVKLENLENSCSIIRDADTADEYNKLISQATMIEQIQALQAQASSNHYNLLSTLISSVAS